MKKLLFGLLLLLPFSARAADTTLAVTAGSGTTIVVTPSGSDVVPHSIPCDHTTPSQCAAFDSTGHLAVLAPPNATALAASNASAPLAAGLMVSDSSLMQRVFAPVIIGDAVNGNNMLATGVWGFNGTTWDRVQVDASKNLKVAPTTGLAQASTTSGQIGPLVQCAVTTSAPTYTTAQTDPLSCDTAGSVRVTVTNTAGPLVDGTSTVVELTGAATTLMVAASSSNTSRILAYHIESDAAGGTYKFVQGTHGSADCDTSVTALTGVIPADNSAHPGSTHGSGTGTLIKATSTNKQICLVTTGGGVGFHGFVTGWNSTP